MADALRPVAIPELLAAAEPELSWTFEQSIPGLETATPVQGWLRLRLDGPLLQVEGAASTSVALQCDRCLQTYLQPLSVEAAERLGLGTSSEDLDAALAFDAEGISEQLDPQGSFDPAQWIYEQLNLQLPLVNRCGRQCPGPASWGHSEPLDDPRWAALKGLRP